MFWIIILPANTKAFLPKGHLVKTWKPWKIPCCSVFHMPIYSAFINAISFGNDYGRLVSEELFIKLSLRINDLLIKTPEERYLALLDEDSRIAQRIPQYMIASFLGVTPETLSRIRRRIAEGGIS